MKKWSWLVAPAIVIALAAGPAMAAKGGGKQTATGGTSSTIKLESYSDLRLGGYVGFDTNAVGLAGWEYPMVEVGCYQSGTLVYMELNKPGAEFLLGGASSKWLTNGGGASCQAILYAYGWKGGQESIRSLDASVSFDAAG
jgi:hypothetical protein